MCVCVLIFCVFLKTVNILLIYFGLKKLVNDDCFKPWLELLLDFLFCVFFLSTCIVESDT